jgi:hypothetical protein
MKTSFVILLLLVTAYVHCSNTKQNGQKDSSDWNDRDGKNKKHDKKDSSDTKDSHGNDNKKNDGKHKGSKDSDSSYDKDHPRTTPHPSYSSTSTRSPPAPPPPPPPPPPPTPTPAPSTGTPKAGDSCVQVDGTGLGCPNCATQLVCRAGVVQTFACEDAMICKPGDKTCTFGMTC